MCGIVGAVAERNVVNILIEGLRRLEYRGYDSAGIAVVSTKPSPTISRLRAAGKVQQLVDELNQTPIRGNTGIAHTRWATHGKPSRENAHPLFSQDELAVVHNGIIENHQELREQLSILGYQFESQTDTEVVAHQIHLEYQQTHDLLQAVRRAIVRFKGAYSLAVLSLTEPHRLIGVRCGSPLVVGLGFGEYFLASDPQALLPVTQRFIYMGEGDIVDLTLEGFLIYDHQGQVVGRDIQTLNVQQDPNSKGDYRHFMLKEIYQQPSTIAETLQPHLVGDHLLLDTLGPLAREQLHGIERIEIVACGSSYHAGLIGQQWLETLARIPCRVEIASEHRYRSLVVEPNTLFLAISQSGETADTLAALRRGRELNYHTVMGICNIPHGTLVRESSVVFLTRAGVEVGVAATKTFTAQLVALLTFSLMLAQHRGIDSDLTRQLQGELLNLPEYIQKATTLNATIKEMAKDFQHVKDAIFLGRGLQFPVALEGALKLKEISYVHAEAYPAGELKHGPLALIDENMPVILCAAYDALSDKIESNIQEVLARGGRVYVFADERLNWDSTDRLTVIPMEAMPSLIAPIAYTIPMQLLSYHIAVSRGTDVDQPRNLAKSVTVE